MIIRISDDFDLLKIADSGQCFRWERTETGWRIPHGGRCLRIEPAGENEYRLDCTEEDFRAVWRDYFDLGENYGRIRARIDPERDPFLWAAEEYGKGIRILRQDPWEMLVTSILTQNRNIPGIRRCVRLLAEACGERKRDSEGEVWWVFPGPAAVLSIGGEGLARCAMGYRAKYVEAAARAALDGRFRPEFLARAGGEETMAALTALYGVGVKVASCVALFGLHRLNAFPEDVWMRRILTNEYPRGYPFAEYAPYNGVYQQYMFAYYRERAARANRTDRDNPRRRE